MTLHPKHISIILVLAAGLVAVVFSGAPENRIEEAGTGLQAAPTSQELADQYGPIAEEKEKADRAVLRVYYELFADVFIERGETQMQAFVNTELEAVCPFYMPDGVTYRTCLADYVDSKMAESSFTDAQLIQFDTCEFSDKYYGSLAGFSLYYSCMAYKLN